jgi:asparagine synthase (glutamine-hydrolysing)
MCGIIGVISHSDNSDDRWNHAKAAQAHRGPDGQGEWRGRINKWFIDLAHQRLAILDLSAKGAQPMIHPKTGSLLVFNGRYITMSSYVPSSFERAFRSKAILIVRYCCEA